MKWVQDNHVGQEQLYEMAKKWGVNNPEQYGLTALTPDPPLVKDTVTADTAVDLHLISDIVGASVQEIADLNPSLLRLSRLPAPKDRRRICSARSKRQSARRGESIRW